MNATPPGTLLRLAVRTVRTLVGTGPAVLVVEDLHALDPASLNLVGELATADGLPALLMVATRPAAHAVAPALTGRTLARLCGVRGVVRQHLGPLRPAEVAEVLNQVYADSAADARLVHRVWQHTAGNPYALTELLAAHAGPDTLLTPPDSSAAVPAAAGPATLGPAGVGPAALGSAGAVSAAGGPAVPGSAAVVPGGAVSASAGSVAAVPVAAVPADGVSAAAVPGPRVAAAAELTGREVEVLDCLVAGMSNKQVARALGISVRTVTVHVSNLLRKTGAASRTEAALWAVRQRLTTTPPTAGLTPPTAIVDG